MTRGRVGRHDPHRDRQKHPVFGRDGDHLTVDLPVTFAEAALGATVSVPTLDGARVKVRIAPGTPSGRILRVKGRGVKKGDTSGDLLAKVQVVVPQRLSDAAREALEQMQADESGADPRPSCSTAPATTVPPGRRASDFGPDDDTPVFVISVAAQLAGMHAQTLRQYDRLGLVSPSRTRGGGRRYSGRDVALLREVQRLSQEEGVSLAGIQRILELENQVTALRARVGELADELTRQAQRADARAQLGPRSSRRAPGRDRRRATGSAPPVRFGVAGARPLAARLRRGAESPVTGPANPWEQRAKAIAAGFDPYSVTAASARRRKGDAGHGRSVVVPAYLGRPGTDGEPRTTGMLVRLAPGGGLTLDVGAFPADLGDPHGSGSASIAPPRSRRPSLIATIGCGSPSGRPGQRGPSRAPWPSSCG